MSLKDCTSNLRAPINTRVADKPTVWRPARSPALPDSGAGGRVTCAALPLNGAACCLQGVLAPACCNAHSRLPLQAILQALQALLPPHNPTARPQVKVHSTEWRKVMAGEPVEINPSVSSWLRSCFYLQQLSPLVAAECGPFNTACAHTTWEGHLCRYSRALLQASPSAAACNARQCTQVGHGYKVMTVDEWSARWKTNEAFPECLQCGSKNTKEHHFMQVG